MRRSLQKLPFTRYQLMLFPPVSPMPLRSGRCRVEIAMGVSVGENHDGEALSRALTILAVDDDALILMNTAILLEDLGHIVVEAGSGSEALDLVRTRVDID